MAQKDYIRRGKGGPSRRKKGAGGKLKHSAPLLIGVAAVVVLLFIAGLYFISHQRQSPAPASPTHKNGNNGLPPRPEERWRYIKELENRQPGVTPNKPASDADNINKRPLTAEQQQILQQIQADMRQQPTQLNEVPWNAQPVPSATAPSATQQPAATQQPVTPSASQPAPSQSPVIKPPPVATRWLVQCGSFKNVSQAETVRAQLAFEGFESHISTSDGWQRVVIGPFSSKEKVDATLNQLKADGHNQCIRLAAGG